MKLPILVKISHTIVEMLTFNKWSLKVYHFHKRAFLEEKSRFDHEIISAAVTQWPARLCTCVCVWRWTGDILNIFMTILLMNYHIASLEITVLMSSPVLPRKLVFLTCNWKYVIKYDICVKFPRIFVHSVQTYAKFSCKKFHRCLISILNTTPLYSGGHFCGHAVVHVWNCSISKAVNASNFSPFNVSRNSLCIHCHNSVISGLQKQSAIHELRIVGFRDVNFCYKEQTIVELSMRQPLYSRTKLMSLVSVQKRLKQSKCHLDCGLGWAQGTVH